MDVTHWRGAAGVLAATLALTAAGCGDDEPESEGGSESPTSAEALSVVVLGDSIPYNAAEDCPGCIAFADAYGTALGEELDQTVEVSNRSRHDGAQTRDILEQLTSGELTEPLAGADVVIVSIGFNDQPPYIGPDQPCHAAEPATSQDAIDAAVATTTKCVDEVTATLSQTVADALAEVRGQAPDAKIAALVPYDAWNGWLAVDQLPAPKQQTLTGLISYALNTWRDALCAEVEKVDGVCVDVYTAFNGPDGQQPSGDLLAPDYTHPSQEGNDLIRDLLLEADLVG